VNVIRLVRKPLPRLTDGFAVETRSGNLVVYLGTRGTTAGTVRGLLKATRLNAVQRESAAIAFGIRNATNGARNHLAVFWSVLTVVLAASTAGVVLFVNHVERTALDSRPVASLSVTPRIGGVSPMPHAVPAPDRSLSRPFALLCAALVLGGCVG